MADHPLRPATDRRLGRPLPHQQANQTQVPPQATFAFDPQVSCGISSSFPLLSPTRGQIPTRYSPVRHCRVAPTVRLACVKHAASVRSEPGSNSQVHPKSQVSPGSKTNRPKTLSIPTNIVMKIIQSVVTHQKDTSQRPKFRTSGKTQNYQTNRVQPESQTPRTPPTYPFLAYSICERTNDPASWAGPPLAGLASGEARFLVAGPACVNAESARHAENQIWGQTV